MEIDQNGDARRAWLSQEQLPHSCKQTVQSNFEESPYWRVGLFVAVVVIGIQVFSPEPLSQSTVTPARPAMQPAHVCSMV